MYRLLVTSATYRQQSHVTPALLERDPYNILLTREPRFRIPAESVRDVALRAAGLLSTKVGGPSVFPPIPDGVLNLAYGGFNWKTSTGEDRYRRGIYTFWKRGTTFPMVITFDAPSREACVVKRVKSNTPLQALTLMNDEVFVEAAQAMARRILAAPMADERERVIYAFRLATSRRPTDAEVDRILALLAQARERIAAGQADPLAIAVLDPKITPSDDADIQQLAAWTVVANVLLNLDETVTKG